MALDIRRTRISCQIVDISQIKSILPSRYYTYIHIHYLKYWSISYQTSYYVQLYNHYKVKEKTRKHIRTWTVYMVIIDYIRLNNLESDVDYKVCIVSIIFTSLSEDSPSKKHSILVVLYHISLLKSSHFSWSQLIVGIIY